MSPASNDHDHPANDRVGGAPPQNLLPAGYRLSDRYEIVEHVHSSGMSHVYKAIDSAAADAKQRYVAIKTMRPSTHLDADKDRLLEEEAKKAQRLSHPNVVRVLGFDRHENIFYLVMEWLQGESLNELLRRTQGQPLPAKVVNRIVDGVVAGVMHAHEKDIVHADLNPANVFVTEAREIKLLDFGVARYADDRDGSDSVPAWAAHSYASPEVLSGETPVIADDVFSLACLIYRLKGGQTAFGEVSSLEAKRERLKVRPAPGIDMASWAVLKYGLAYERKDRPHGVAVFLQRANFDHAHTKAEDDEPPARNNWLLAIPVVAAVAVAIALWGYLAPQAPEPAAAPESASAEAPPVADAEVAEEPQPLVEAPDVPPTETLLEAAATAMAEARWIEPSEDNARSLYREVLALDPENDAALRGLRSISDNYVQSAAAALRAENPAAASADLSVAAVTDPENPSVAPVLELMRMQGDNTVAEARIALGMGARERAAALLAQAEGYPHIDAELIAGLKAEITRSALAQRFQDQLAIVDSHIAADRLVEPASGNASALLLELNNQYGDNRQLAAYTERFGERLLTRAAFATAIQRFDEADSLLAAVGALDVLADELTAAQTTLALAREQAESAALAAAAAEETAPAAEEGDAVASLDGDAASVAEPGASGEVGTVITSGVKAGPTIAKADYRTLEELSLLEFVQPTFPVLAETRNQTGYVELAFDVYANGTTGNFEVLNAEPGGLFVPSARNAVRRWRFEQREEIARAKVRLTFVLPQ